MVESNRAPGHHPRVMRWNRYKAPSDKPTWLGRRLTLHGLLNQTSPPFPLSLPRDNVSHFEYVQEFGLRVVSVTKAGTGRFR